MQHCDCLEDSHRSNSIMDVFREPLCSNARAWAWSRQGKKPAGDRCCVQDSVVRVRGGAQPGEGWASSCVMAGDLPLFGHSMVKCCSICNWALEVIEVRGWEKGAGRQQYPCGAGSQGRVLAGTGAVPGRAHCGGDRGVMGRKPGKACQN